ncbi:MAG: phenylalanine--tRNA ligase subunit alpha [Bacilli bacterium]|jgi:phenylalanyl-tRNA synthetase alpha chain
MEHKAMQQILQEVDQAILKAKTVAELNQARDEYLAKKGLIASLMGKIRELPPEEKSSYGQRVNLLKEQVTARFASAQAVLEKAELAAKLAQERIDITLPASSYNVGAKNPFFIIQDELCEIFLALGYEIAEGPEVETDHFNFELLNIPRDHPARDMQDSFYIDDNLLLRTHTSPVQARIMQEKKGKPLKVVCPGKVFRRDDDDPTHSHQFGQLEGLLIAENIHLGHLYATLELFVKAMFGKKREIRFRSSYFPFTEPSVEVDVSCAACNGQGCSMCKDTGWIEILGGGMVHPNVLRMSGYDPDKLSGFAFGVGIERLALLRYGIDDIRKFYQNDVRFLEQFPKR